MAKVGFTNQQCNKVDITVLQYTLKKSTNFLHWKHISMSNALISPPKIGLPFNASSTRIVTKITTNLSLGGTIKNITPQISMTHPTSIQHRTHINKTFHCKLFIKRLSKSCRIQNSN